jgi:hypothetical protein
MHNHPDHPPTTRQERQERRASQRAQQQIRVSRFSATGVAAVGEDDDGYNSVEEEVIDAAVVHSFRKDEHEKEPLERRSLRDKFMDCVDCLVEAFG